MKFRLVITALLLFLYSTGIAQNKSISGIVKDDIGEGIPGVSIVIIGTTNGTISDINGEFRINTSVGDTLQFSFIGKTPVKKVVGKNNIIP